MLQELDLVSDHLEYINTLLVTNQESPELSLYTFKWVRKTIFETPVGKLQNLLGMKLKTDVTWLFLSPVKTEIFVGFFFLQMWTMKLTESKNICCTSLHNWSEYQRKINRKWWFPANIYVVNKLQSSNRRPITWQI